MAQPITPKEFAHAVTMTKKAECVPYATLPALKKMLACRPLDIMDFIEAHPDLIHTEQRHETKYVKERMSIPGTNRAYYDTVEKIGRNLGLCVIEAFETPEDNPWTEAGLRKLIEENRKTVWVSEVNDYGQVLGEVLREDTIPTTDYGLPKYSEGERPADARKAPWLWRNTKEKLEALREISAVSEKTYWMGGFGDSYSRKEPYSLSAESIKILEAAGWKLIRR